MEIKLDPRPYEEWSTDAIDREEDAAYTFGYHLITNCRDEAIASVPADASADTKAAVEEAVDIALHNVVDMLEGFFKLEAGTKHTVELVLGVRVLDAEHKEIETLEISPCKLDLPIGYWKWACDREFR